MPKDEFDFEDPMELTGVALATEEDATDAMCECFVEEFMMMGYDPLRILALFRHPHYIGMNMVLQNRGEQFVRDRIGEIFARWGRRVAWPAVVAPPERLDGAAEDVCPGPKPSEPAALDPTGSPAPTYHL